MHSSLSNLVDLFNYANYHHEHSSWILGYELPLRRFVDYDCISRDFLCYDSESAIQRRCFYQHHTATGYVWRRRGLGYDEDQEEGQRVDNGPYGTIVHFATRRVGATIYLPRTGSRRTDEGNHLRPDQICILDIETRSQRFAESSNPIITTDNKQSVKNTSLLCDLIADQQRMQYNDGVGVLAYLLGNASGETFPVLLYCLSMTAAIWFGIFTNDGKLTLSNC